MSEEIQFHYHYEKGEEYKPEIGLELEKIGLKQSEHSKHSFREEMGVWGVYFDEEKPFLRIDVEDHFFFDYVKNMDEKKEKIFVKIFEILDILKKYFKIDSLKGESYGGTVYCLISKGETPKVSGVKKKFGEYTIIFLS